MDDSPETVAELVARWPEAAALLEASRRAPGRWMPENGRWGFRIESLPAPASSGEEAPTFHTTSRAVRVDVADDGSGALRIGVERHAWTVGVRRPGAAAARATLDEGAVFVRDASPGVDAAFFAAQHGVEELLVLRDASAEAIYDLELPDGFQVRAPTSIPGLIEVLDERGIAGLRIRANRGWDASGREVALEPRIEGSRLRVGVAGEPTWPVVVDPEWQDAGTMALPRNGHTATLLPDGQVLLAGGAFGTTAELFDPVTRQFTLTEFMALDRADHTATLLPDGVVLLAGGAYTDVLPKTTAELYYPELGGFSLLGAPMAAPRSHHTATRLPDGRVLLVGGRTGDVGTEIASVEEFDPSTGGFTDAGALATPRSGAAAAALPDGKILVAGGGVGPFDIYDTATKTSFQPSSSDGYGARVATLVPGGLVLLCGTAWPCRLVDPASLEVVGTSDVYTPLASATLLPGGHVLLVGHATFSYALPLDLASMTEVSGSNIPGNRTFHTATLLADGSVLVAGGIDVDAQTAGVYTPLAYPPVAGKIVASGELAEPTTFDPTAVRLPEGQVLFTGGTGAVGVGSAKAQRFDPATSLVTSAGTMAVSRGRHTSTLLPDGRVLLVGFEVSAGVRGAFTAEVYDPALGTFTALRAPNHPHTGHTATLLPNGRVLIAGGEETQPAELFDSASATFTDTGAMASRSGHTATLLPSGRVLLAGGSASASDQAELYDPATGTFTATGYSVLARRRHTATLVPTGEVLIAGGIGPNDVPTATVELFLPGTGEFNTIPGMSIPRAGHTATLLPNGRVLLAGGTTASTKLELYDPHMQTFTLALGGDLNDARAGSTATLLADGRVLIGAGEDVAKPATWEAWDGDGLGSTSWRPALKITPEAVKVGHSAAIVGAGLTGISEAAGGMTNASPTNYPVALWLPTEGIPSMGTITGWSDSAGTWTAPKTSFPGPGLLFAVTNGIRSSGVHAVVGPSLLGTPCRTATDCASGFCVDAVCCEDACDDACYACGPDGACLPLQTGTPDAACSARAAETCGTTGACDSGQCALWPDGTPCPDGGKCDGGECVTDGGVSGLVCDGDHTLLEPNGSPSTDCSPFRCAQGSDGCLNTCTSSRDCITGLACSVDGRCEPPIAVADTSCDIARPRSTRTWPGGLLAIAVVLTIARRRRGGASLSRRTGA